MEGLRRSRTDLRKWDCRVLRLRRRVLPMKYRQDFPALVRRTDRRPLEPKHEGPFYGWSLARLLAAVPPEDAHDRDRQMTWLIVCTAVPIAIGLAVLIVLL